MPEYKIPTARTSPEILCHHCGTPCEEDHIEFEDKDFCCHGCRAVYELIEGSNLGVYYQNRELYAGKVARKEEIDRKYAFLDQEEVSAGLLHYADDNQSAVRFALPGIHCSSCIYLLEHLPKLESRIFNAEVNFLRKEITILFSKEMTLREVAVTLATLGYPPAIHLDSVETTQPRKSNKQALRIAVAGFCFGNSMLMSLPEYLDSTFQAEAAFRNLFGWINLFLSVPVVFYAAQEYYKSAWRSIRHGYLNIDIPITLGIFTLFLRSGYEILWAAGPGYVDSLAGLVFFLLLGKWYQSKSYEALSFERDYKSYFPVSVTRVVSSREEQVLVRDLMPGDCIVLHNQELIPADGILQSGNARIDYSFVTGEADSILVSPGERVYAGGRQLGGQIEVSLEKAVNTSKLTQLWNNQTFTKSANPYDNLIDKVSKYFTVVILMLALGTGIYWSIADPTKIWDAVASVLIVACPCALALALPFGLGHGMRLLGYQGVYLKNAGVIEQMAKTETIVFDKTGTLTKNNPSKVSYQGSDLTPTQRSLLKTACANSAHPISRLILGTIEDKVEKLPITEFNEQVGKGLRAEIAGHVVKVGSSAWVNQAANNVPETTAYVEIDGVFIGFYSIKAEYREGIFSELSHLQEDYRLCLLSGDNVSEAVTLAPYFDQLAFNQKPEEKLSFLQKLQDHTLMIGDGLNDAGALKSASVGFAVCEDIHQFSPACDALVEADSLRQMGTILRFSKTVMNVIVAAFVISFCYNIVGLSFAISGHLTPVVSAILMPVSSVTVVAFITLAINGVSKKYFQ
ncbi:heavy metal translocating P-type ATPase [Marinoscillum sp.]|uniref:heavy metal translocating P-type ATPase n=1 Tax=Marinoscillum sp. TaxID=2024838 RepID=UPI003BA9F2EA